MRSGREYLRVSKDRSGRLRSPSEQHDENVTVANRRDVLLGEPYREVRAVGASRQSTGTRDDFARLLGEIDSGQFRADELWLWEPSRGSRKVSEWVTLLEVCEKRGIRIYVTTHSRLYDPTNHRDRRTLLEDAVDSEYAASKTSEQVKRSARARAAAGLPHGQTLYGYRREHDSSTGAVVGGLAPDEATASIVREVFNRYAEGEGMTAIARSLTRRGVPTPASAAVWRNSSVRSMLTNEGYLGHRVSPRAGYARVENAWPAIVDDALWWRCKGRLDDPGRAPRLDCNVKHLLSGLVDCGVPGCTSKFQYKAVPTGRRGHHDSYTCVDFGHNSRMAGAWSPDPDECRGLEGQVVEFVLTLWEGDERLGRSGEDPRIGEVDAQLRGLRAELRMWQDSPGTDGVTPASVAGAERRLIPQIEAAERQLAGLRAHAVLPDLGDRTLREAWPTLTLAQRRTIIAASVTVRVCRVGRGKRYDPASVDIASRWRSDDGA